MFLKTHNVVKEKIEKKIGEFVKIVHPRMSTADAMKALMEHPIFDRECSIDWELTLVFLIDLVNLSSTLMAKRLEPPKKKVKKAKIPDSSEEEEEEEEEEDEEEDEEENDEKSSNRSAAYHSLFQM